MLTNFNLRTIKYIQAVVIILGFLCLITKYVLKYKYDYPETSINLWDGLFRTFFGISFFVGIERLRKENKEEQNKLLLKVLGWVFLVSGIYSVIMFFRQ